MMIKFKPARDAVPLPEEAEDAYPGLFDGPTPWECDEETWAHLGRMVPGYFAEVRGLCPYCLGTGVDSEGPGCEHCG